MTGIVDEVRLLADATFGAVDRERYGQVDSAFAAVMGMYAAMKLAPESARKALADDTESCAKIRAELRAACAVVSAVLVAVQAFYGAPMEVEGGEGN